VVSEGKYSLVSAIASGIHVNFSDSEIAEQIITKLKGRNIRAVLGTDDLTVVLAAQVSKWLGLIHNDPASSQYTRRKDLARMCLAKSEVCIPAFEIHSLHQLIDNAVTALTYPCVIKPLALSGSRGVMRVNNREELQHACQRLQTILANAAGDDEERTHVLLEAYIPGYEYAYEGLLNKGRLQTLALFDKPDLMEGPFFEETYYIMPSRLDSAIQKQIHNAVQQACEAYGLVNGPVHAEVRIHDEQVWFMEMASRTIGGQCAQLVNYATGMELEEIVIRQAAGMPVHLHPAQHAAGVLMIPTTKHGLLRRVEGLLEASKLEWIEDIEISIREGYEIVPLPEGDSYLGFIFATAPTPALVENALRQAYARLTIVTSPLLHHI
jgi:biotin carboxylase